MMMFLTELSGVKRWTAGLSTGSGKAGRLIFWHHPLGVNRKREERGPEESRPPTINKESSQEDTRPTIKRRVGNIFIMMQAPLI